MLRTAFLLAAVLACTAAAFAQNYTGTFTTTNPQGYSTAGNVMQLIADKIQGQTVAYCAYNEKLRSHKIVPQLSSWKQKQTSGTWGTILRSPMAVAGMLGI